MIVTSDYLAALLTNYQAQFGSTWNERENADVLLQLARRMPSSTLTETVPFVGAGTTGPQDVTHGTVVFQNGRQYTLSIENKTWQDGYEVQREAFADDRYKMYANYPAHYANEFKAHIGRIVGDLFELNGLAYDGIAMFANSRALGLTAQVNDNLLTATGTYTTAANVFTDIRAGQTAAMAFTNDKGVAMGIRLNTIIVPIGLYDQFYQALMYNSYINQPTGQLAPTGDSFQAGEYKVIMNRQLTDAGDWYMTYVNQGTGKFPFVWSDREAPHMEGTTSTDSYEWRVLRKAQYTFYGRYNAGYGNPLYAVKFA